MYKCIHNMSINTSLVVLQVWICSGSELYRAAIVREELATVPNLEASQHV